MELPLNTQNKARAFLEEHIKTTFNTKEYTIEELYWYNNAWRATFEVNGHFHRINFDGEGNIFS